MTNNSTLIGRTPFTDMDETVTLDIGGHLFKIRADHLSILNPFYFVNRPDFVDLWYKSRQKDGSFFFNTDPEVFPYLFTFMHATKRFPL